MPPGEDSRSPGAIQASEGRRYAVNRGLLWLVAIPVLAGWWTVAARSQEDVEGPYPEATGALDTLESAARVPHNPGFERTPLTVELWVRLRSQNAYNILIAHEAKASNAHWEIFSLPQSGYLTAYLPGCTPDHIRSEHRVTDGRWHYVAMVSQADSVALFVDGAEVARTEVARVAEPHIEPGPLFIGSLVSRGFSCDGEIAEVRISQAALDVSAVPAEPMVADETTLGLWRPDDSQGTFQDVAGVSGPAETVEAVHGADRIDLSELTAAQTARMDLAQGEPEGPSLAIPPPHVDLTDVRARYAGARGELSIERLPRPGDIRDAVLTDWEEQRFRLGLRIEGKEPLPPRIDEEIYDRHSLCGPEDGDPLGVVLRRTNALLRNLAMRGVDAELVDAWRAFEAAAQAVEVGEDERHGLYYAACALRREIIFQNPLLDFDKLLFVARGVYLGSRVTGTTSTRDVYGQHFATQ
ncbi:MAG: hypothetical protein GF320_12305, partial [Armatimonadia bacterium]|nr:hypothetical protein [Armatimonadia bacterium]